MPNCRLNPRLKLSELAELLFWSLSERQQGLVTAVFNEIANERQTGVVHEDFSNSFLTGWSLSDTKVHSKWGVKVIYGFTESFIEIDTFAVEPQPPGNGAPFPVGVAASALAPYLEMPALIVKRGRMSLRAERGTIVCVHDACDRGLCHENDCACAPSALTGVVRPARGVERVDRNPRVFDVARRDGCAGDQRLDHEIWVEQPVVRPFSATELHARPDIREAASPDRLALGVRRHKEFERSRELVIAPFDHRSDPDGASVFVRKEFGYHCSGSALGDGIEGRRDASLSASGGDVAPFAFVIAHSCNAGGVGVS